MTATKQANIKAFNEGMAKVEKRMALLLNNKLVSLAQEYVERAIRDWQACEPALKKDMTGNLITGFASGVYKDGKLIHVAGATEGGVNSVSGQPEYWMVGSRDLTAWEDRGLAEEYGESHMFYDYDTGAKVYDVFQYKKKFKFQDVPERRYAIDLAVSFLHGYAHNVPKQGYFLVVCNGATYADYLRTARRLDVLTSLNAEVASRSNGEFVRELTRTLNSMRV